MVWRTAAGRRRSVADLKEKWGALKECEGSVEGPTSDWGGGRPLPSVDFEDVIVGIIEEESPIFDGLNGKLANYLYEYKYLVPTGYLR